MHIVRTIMALVIALSVALLPTVGSAAPMVHSTSQDASAAVAKQMVMASDMSGAMDDCCPDATSKIGDQPCHQCPMVCCAVQLINLADADAVRLASPSAAGHLLPLPEDQVASAQSASPPFRPPRV